MNPEQFQALVDRVEKVESSIVNIERNSSELLDAFRAVKGAFTTIEWVGKAAKQIIPFFILAGALVYSLKIIWDKVLKWASM